MNRLLLSALLIVGLRSFAFAAEAPVVNDGTITSPAQLPQNATTFINRGSISLGVTSFAAGGGVLLTGTGDPFEFDTLNFTNKGGSPQLPAFASGLIIGSPGFWFNRSFPSGVRRWSANFFNDNSAQIEAADPSFLLLSSQNFVSRAAVGESLLRIWSTNIVVKTGPSASSFLRPGRRGASLVVGANGLLDIQGGNVDLSRSGLMVLSPWNESIGSINFRDGTFRPDIAVDDLAAAAGSFSTTPAANHLNTAALWDGQIATSAGAAPTNVVVPSFVLDSPEADFYISAVPKSFGLVALTNFNFAPLLATNFVPVTNIMVLITNQVFVPATTQVITNLFSTNFVVGTVTPVVLNTQIFPNVFTLTNGTAFDTNFSVLTTNLFIVGNFYVDSNSPAPLAVPTFVRVFTNVTKGAFFGQAPPGFVITHGFFGGVLQATVSDATTNLVTGQSETSGVFIQDTIGGTTARGLLTNLITGGLPPQNGTSRPANYLVSRSGLFSGFVFDPFDTNGIAIFTNIFQGSISRPPAPNFFLSSGIQDSNNFLFFDSANTTVFDSVTNSEVEAGDYSGYTAFFDDVVIRENTLINSGFANETNRTGRVQIHADRLNLEKTRISAQGLITVNTPHLISSSNTVIDCESLSFDLASTNGTLRLQNLSKDSVNRLKGSISLWSAIWSNSVTVVFWENYALTNGSTISITNPIGSTNVTIFTNLVVVRAPLTNTFGVLFHTTMLDARGLSNAAPVTVYDLALRSKNIFIDDNATVVRPIYIGGQSLTINGNLSLYNIVKSLIFDGRREVITYSQGNNGNWFATNAPNLAFFTNNGNLLISNEGHFGDDRQSPYAAFVNNGLFNAYSLRVKSAYIENPGIINVSGAVLDVNADTGWFADGTSTSGGEMYFSGNNLTFSDYTATANGAFYFNITNHLGDLGSAFPNTFDSPNGFNLLSKPATGDLLGSTFISHAHDALGASPVHTWAAEDRGPSGAGFVNNVAVGTLSLTLDSSGNVIDPLFVFRGTGAKNAMYVDLLDLSSLSDYTNQLAIEDNFTIYFASASLGFTPPDVMSGTNLVPQTPEEFLNGQFGGRLQWVKDFAGPNSSTTVIINGQSVVVNSALAQSWVNQGIDPSTQLNLTPVSVIVNGNGLVSPLSDSQSLIKDQTYTVTALPNPGATFLGWQGSFETNSPQLTFVAEDGIVLIANFSFTATAASYNGLFYTSNSVEFLKSGAITITTTKTGKYSGSAQYGAKRYSFSGTLSESGSDERPIPNTPLFLTFQVGTDHITGNVAADDWVADLYMDRVVFSKTNSAPFAGRYTLLFPGSGDVTNTALPFGNGYGAITVDALGKVKFTGLLADGTKISQSSVASGEGHWPLYIPLYKGGGQLLSWESFADTGDKDVGGDYSWIKPADPKFKIYPDGFTFQTNSFGSLYNPALSPLTGFADALVVLAGADLTTNILNHVFVTNKVINLGTNKFTMSINSAQGTFTGSAPNPATGKAIKFGGALLQKQGYGAGYFLGTNQSGSVIVVPTP